MNPLNTSGKFPEVVGYISEQERIALQLCVLEVTNILGDAIEVGSLNGLSALLTLSVLPSWKTLICVECGQVETLKENLDKYGLCEGHKVGVLNQDFKEIPKLKTNPQFCWCFIDHDHTYENTMAAFDKFWPMITEGGIMAFHDYGHVDFQGGTRALNEIMEASTKHGIEVESKAGGFIAFRKI